MPRPYVAILLCNLLSGFVGCGTLPDLEPYADATAELQYSVSTTHDIIYKELSILAAHYPDDKDFVQFPEKFSKVWEPRIKVMEALVEYSDSLAAIAAAAREGRKDAEALAGSLERLASAAGGPIGLSGTAGGQIAMVVYGAVQEIRATRELEKAISAADPAIQEISKHILADFKTLEELLAPNGLEATIEAAIKQSYTNRFGADPAYRKKLIDLQRAEQNRIHAEIVKDTPDATVLNSARDRLSQLKVFLEATKEWHEKQSADLTALRDRFAAQRQILKKTIKGLEQWSQIHHALATTLQKNKERPNFRLLLNTALEIRSLVSEEGKK